MDFIKIYIIDIILLLIFSFCLLYYYRKGFVKTILSLFFLFASALLTRALSPYVIEYLCENIDFFKSDFGEYKANIISVAAIFVILNILFRIILFVINKLFDLPVLKTVNKSLGLLLGAVCGLLLIAVFVSVIKLVCLFDLPEFQKAAESSVIVKLYSQLIIYIYPSINQFIKGGLNK